jgi:ABC-type sugar transport system ATPase subunit
MARMPKDEIARRVESVSTQLEIGALLERRPKDLSGGQRQRVAMGRAMIREPKVFLFDEPLSNLDAELRVRLRLEISQMQRALGATMVFVTHDQVEAMTLADHIVIMREGRIEQIGTPLDVYHKPANRFVAGFIGSPTMNILSIEAAELTKEGAHVRLPGGMDLDIQRPIDGMPRLLGVRPEHVQVGDLANENRIEIAEAEIEVLGTEHLGDRSFRHVRLCAGELTFRVPEASQSGGNLILGFPGDHLYLFDQNGQAI